VVASSNIVPQNPNTIAKSQEHPVGFLQEDNGNYSSMRLMSFIALISAIFFAGYTLVKPEVKDVGINLTFSFLVAAFAPKAVQKFAENRVL
jgi:hypothetical protein